MIKNEDFKIRKAIQSLESSPIRKIANTAIGKKDIIPLYFGETDIPTPSFISQAMKNALDAGQTFYSANQGVPELVNIVSKYTSSLHKNYIAPSRIMITSAGMNALMITSEALINPKDKVICITPVWPNFMRCIEIMGGEVIEIPLIYSDVNNTWKLNIEEIKKHIKDVKAIYINSPNNPTGWMINLQEQMEILELCRKNKTWIISDEVYERIVYDRNVAPSFLDLTDENDLLIVANSFSKSWAMTGWRLGWMVIPENLLSIFEKLNEYNVASPSSPAQYAGITAISEGEDFLKKMIYNFKISRELVMNRLSDFSRITLPLPEAAFYAYFKIEDITDSEKFCLETLDKTGVGLAPGTSFGKGGDSWVRLCYAKNPDLLNQAFDKLKPVFT
ncbi:pyridoxal phosphate-dependent aminotransferase [Alphaproteobacteria bacterium]|nr:pyridoxal phosphate-dependent aminotransferase [Alphaproteobacteria bacterium]